MIYVIYVNVSALHPFLKILCEISSIQNLHDVRLVWCLLVGDVDDGNLLAGLYEFSFLGLVYNILNNLFGVVGWYLHCEGASRYVHLPHNTAV